MIKICKCLWVGRFTKRTTFYSHLGIELKCILLSQYFFFRRLGYLNCFEFFTNISCLRDKLHDTKSKDRICTTEQSCSTCYHFKWGKPKTQIPSKICQKIGYGKTSLHINHFLYCCPLIKSVKVLWMRKKIYNTIQL